MNKDGLRETKISDDLYILTDLSDGYIDLHSQQLDEDGALGVVISLEEVDLLIEALMQLRKEVEEDY